VKGRKDRLQEEVPTVGRSAKQGGDPAQEIGHRVAGEWSTGTVGVGHESQIQIEQESRRRRAEQFAARSVKGDAELP
jgi:hypothetical protein